MIYVLWFVYEYEEFRFVSWVVCVEDIVKSMWVILVVDWLMVGVGGFDREVIEVEEYFEVDCR